MPTDQSKMFDINILNFKIFAISPGRTPSKYYKYYSFLYLIVTFICYNVLLTLNLYYTPQTIDLFIPEVIFYFTEISICSKVLTVILMHDKLIGLFNFIDCDEFEGDYKNKNGILYKTNISYRLGWKLYAFFSNLVYSSQVFVPIFVNLIRGTSSQLPICKYYFLSDEMRESHFLFWFVYQSFGMYGHMMYNVNFDSLTAGLLVFAIVQLQLLNNNLCNLKLSEEECKLPIDIQDRIQMDRLNRNLKHYDVILDYCDAIQNFLSVTIFVQFITASLIICVVMCGLLLPSSTATLVFMVMYLFTMTIEIFVPAFLGNELSFKSEELMIAAYNSEWIPRSEQFKKSLRLFVERAKTPIMITGLKMFSLSLLTFTSIMKTAYSFFTLIRNVQDE